MTPSAWLIEAPGPHYIGVRELACQYEFYWTKEANAALAFQSKEQAEKTAWAVQALKPDLFAFARTLGDAVAREHGFINAI